jgi:Tol biopolymer transport system component
MLDDRLTQQLRRAAEYAAETARQPDPRAIRRRSRSRRWRQVAVVAVTACVLTAGLVVADFNDRPRTVEPALPTVTAPTSFLADVGGRLAVVSTASGKVSRYLTKAPAGGFAYALSEDRAAVWFSDGVYDCRRPSGLYRVPYQGGKPVKVDGSVSAEVIAISRDGSKIAYRPYPPPSCSGPSIAMAVLDLRTGKMRTWSYSSRREAMLSMTWSPDGRHLAYVESFGIGPKPRTRAWLLDTAGVGKSLAASKAVPAPDEGCFVRDLAWQPGSGLLAISESCPASYQLVYVKAPGGQPVARPMQRDRSFVNLDFDASGRHLLFTDDPAFSGSSVTTWRYDGTKAVEIAKGIGGQQSGVAW